MSTEQRSPLLFHVFLTCLLITIIPRIQGDGETTLSNPDELSQCNSTCKYVDWAYDANCRDRNLDSIPRECWEAKMLDLRNNRIVQIIENAFESFKNLLYVDLEDNGITELDSSAFVGNDRVRHIYLQSNFLESIHRGTFTGVPNLLQLYLNSNRISSIEVGAFSRLSKLETLFLNENVMEDIAPGLLAGLERLRYFHMTHNRLTVLRNNTFKDLTHLRNLNLINNNIRIIEAGAFKGLISLRVLRLAYNEIAIIGHRPFFQMRQLTQLDLYSNQIQTITNFTTGLNNIVELYLGDNPLKCDCRLEPLHLWFEMKTHYITDTRANATCNDPENGKRYIISNMDAMPPCPSPTPHKELMKEKNPIAAQHVAKVKQNQIQNAAVQTSTIAVIAIACVVLFAVCFIGLICFIYNAYIRIPYTVDDKGNIYKPVQKVNLTTNPLEEI